MFKKNIVVLFLYCLFFLLLVSCSSTNYAKRYGQHQVNDQIKTTDIPRFTSSDSIMELEKENVSPFDLAIYEDDEDEEDVDLEMFIYDSKTYTAKELKERFRLSEVNRHSLSRKSILLNEIVDYLATPYRYGKTGLAGTDCSGFTRNALEKLNIQLPRSAREQFQLGDSIEKPSLQFGDLVFFNTRRKSFPGHVGIYLGDDMFVHASTKKGVIVSSMDETYYKTRYVGARRITTFEKENQKIGDVNDLQN